MVWGRKARGFRFYLNPAPRARMMACARPAILLLASLENSSLELINSCIPIPPPASSLTEVAPLFLHLFSFLVTHHSQEEFSQKLGTHSLPPGKYPQV